MDRTECIPDICHRTKELYPNSAKMICTPWSTYFYAWYKVCSVLWENLPHSNCDVLTSKVAHKSENKAICQMLAGQAGRWLGRRGYTSTSGPFLRTPFSHWFLLSYLICYISDNCNVLCCPEVFHKILWEVEFGIEIIATPWCMLLSLPPCTWGLTGSRVVAVLQWGEAETAMATGQSPKLSFSSKWWKCVKTIRLGPSSCQICTWTCFFPSGSERQECV